MTLKTNGHEFKQYYSDPFSWPDGAWHDDILILVDGVEVSNGTDLTTINDAAKVEIQYGVVYSHENDNDPINMELHFKRWRKAQQTRTLLVQVDASKLEELQKLIKAAGGKLL